MKLDFYRIFFNVTLVSAALAQISAQIFKVFLPVFKGHAPDFKKFFHYGDIPSAHTAFIVAVTTSVGFKEGWDSSLFGVAFVIAGILIYDILKLRKTVELNQKLVTEVAKNDNIVEKEHRPQFKGHSPIEVLSGIVWGILWAVVTNLIFVNEHIIK